MISEEREPKSGTKLLIGAFIGSLLIHALLLPAFFWTWSRSLLLSIQPPKHELIISSTAVRIERRQVTRPPAHATQPAQQAVPPAAAAPAAAPAAAAPRPELARPAPTAPPQPPARKSAESTSSLEQQIARQEQTFSQEVARLNQHENPLSIAPQTRESPAAYRRTYFDVPGHVERNAVQAILIPLRHWIARDMSCYYVRYVAQFTTGGSEEGVIPWPVCYALNDDEMIHPPYPHDLPIPLPQRDYVLPPGTYLTPLLKSIYDRRG
jgi:hypothetical protein